MRSAPDTQTALVISIIKKGDVYSGVVNAGGTAETPIRKISLTGNRLLVETGSDSKLGDVTLTTDLMIDGNKATGGGTFSVASHRFPVTIELQRRPRAEVIQPQVEQRADYFVGRWTFEYLGGEFPPLSAGTRTGTATFTKTGTSNFISGVIENDSAARNPGPHHARLRSRDEDAGSGRAAGGSDRAHQRCELGEPAGDHVHHVTGDLERTDLPAAARHPGAQRRLVRHRRKVRWMGRDSGLATRGTVKKTT
jgi:hypothetical protein